MKISKQLLARTLCLGVALSMNAQAYAGDYYTSVPFVGSVSIGTDGTGATPVDMVFGKEYSHTNPTVPAVFDPRIINIEDHNAFAMPDTLQVVLWDGLPGLAGTSGSNDGFDYNAVMTALDGEVDALGNNNDFLFNQVIDNEATLLFSMTRDTDMSGALKDRVHYEAPSGASATWAGIETAPPAGVNHHPVQDLDALEVWGPEPPSHSDPEGIPNEVVEGYIGGGPGVGAPVADADRFSLDADVASGTSVWAYDPSSGFSLPYIPHATIVAAVEMLRLAPGEIFDLTTKAMIDVDGMMVRDNGEKGEWDAGDGLLFTLDPIDTPTAFDPAGGSFVAAPLHGGEIFVLENMGASFMISYLSHGGHLWDSAFSPSSAFDYEYEDIDALEAVGVLDGSGMIDVPEPSTYAALSIMLGMLGFRQRRRELA